MAGSPLERASRRLKENPSHKDAGHRHATHGTAQIALCGSDTRVPEQNQGTVRQYPIAVHTAGQMQFEILSFFPQLSEASANTRCLWALHSADKQKFHNRPIVHRFLRIRKIGKSIP
jgi:hypothetical protein